MTPITVKSDIGDCVSFILAGPAKLKADDLTDNQTVTLYEERSDGEYDPVRVRGMQVNLTQTQPSFIIEGYGNYKCLGTVDDLIVGMES